jgi:hypothetical protein
LPQEPVTPPPATKPQAQPPRTSLLSYEAFRKQQEQKKQTPPEVQEPGTTVLPEEQKLKERPFDLLSCWMEFSVSLNAQGKPAEAILMKDVKPLLDGDIIRIEVAGSHQRDMMDQIRPLLLEHIRQQYRKFLTLEVSIGEYKPTALKPYTDKEKLNAMMEQNPMIRDLVDRLKLRLR